ncbi:MAG: hypothetical protein E6R09_19380 [Rhodocyclaceae bacterium]|nr:MAG: hypothetical protein E6R09_19380 [Rhodocyclaceae bacterium]
MPMPGSLKNPLHQRLLLWCILVLLAVSMGISQVMPGHQVLQTNLLALLPPTERNPVAEMAIQRLSGVTENQAFFLIGDPDAEKAVRSASRFASALRESGEFVSVTLEVDSSRLGLIKDWIREHRFRFMSESDNKDLKSGHPSGEQLVQRAQRKLISPISGPQSLDFAEDPLGLAQGWFDSLPLRTVKLTPERGALTVHEAGQTWVFVLASIHGSAYDHSSAQKALVAIELAEHKAGAAKVLRAGTIFHAEAARHKAQSDVDLIGAGSLLGMLGLLYWVFKSFKPLVGALVSVLFGVLAGGVTCVAVYGELHLITLVFGASLIGEAVDYAVQYFAAHIDAGTTWEPLAELNRMKAGLTVALATSLLGYAALWFSPFLALSQIALFAMVGLLAAWLSVFLFLPWWLQKPASGVFVGRAELQRKWLLFWQHRMSFKSCLALVTIVLLVSVPGWIRIEGRDDVRLLIAPDTVLSSQESQLKTLTGLDNSSQFFLIEGQDENEVLIREEVLRNLLSERQSSGDLTGYQATSLFVPSDAFQARALDAWDRFVFSPSARLNQALERVGVNDQVASRMQADWQYQRLSKLDVEKWLKAPVSIPWRHLWIGQTKHGYASVILPVGLKQGVSLNDVAAQVPGVSWVDKAGSVGRLFREYRHYSSLWLIGAIGLVYCLLAWRYGMHAGLAIFAPTVLAIVFSLGAYGWMGHPLTLFNMMALMLVLGIGVNYAIFLVEGGARSSITFVGVQLSAATTLLSFGLLAFSSMPVLSGFGLNLTFGIAFAVLLAPMALSLSPKGGGQS